jgi:hypothetical protein
MHKTHTEKFIRPTCYHDFSEPNSTRNDRVRMVRRSEEVDVNLNITCKRITTDKHGTVEPLNDFKSNHAPKQSVARGNMVDTNLDMVCVFLCVHGASNKSVTTNIIIVLFLRHTNGRKCYRLNIGVNHTKWDLPLM